MIAANKRLLKANLTQGVLGIQTNLIELYTSNLSALGTQSALIAGFSFTGVITLQPQDGLADSVLAYFFYVCFTISLVAALFVLSQSTIVVNFGPTMALKGNSADSVKIAAIHMRKQLGLIYVYCCIAITALFIGACLLCWSVYPIGIAVITTCCYTSGYYLLVKHGIDAYNTFVANDNEIFQDTTSNDKGTEKSILASAVYKLLPNPLKDNNASANPETPSDQSAIAGVSNEAIEGIKLKARGILWKRQPIEEGGLFVKCYAVLEKGRLDFYKSIQDYREDGNPLNKKPLKLWQLELETDPRKFEKKVTAVRNVLKTAMVGNDDFSVGDLLSSEYDLKFAAKNFKFALVPKVSSELIAVENTELLAHDDKSFKQWVQALGTVISAYNEISSSPSVEQTMRMGVADVEAVVQAANNN